MIIMVAREIRARVRMVEATWGRVLPRRVWLNSGLRRGGSIAEIVIANQLTGQRKWSSMTLMMRIKRFQKGISV